MSKISYWLTLIVNESSNKNVFFVLHLLVAVSIYRNLSIDLNV